MAVLKRIKFGSTTTPIAMTQVAIDSQSSTVLGVTPSNTGLDVNEDPVYTIALTVDGKTIAKGANGLETSLALKVEAASGEGASAKKARIALVDSNGGSGYAELSSVNIEDIVGNGVITSTSYDETTGILTITWAGGSTTAVNLGKLLDIDDIVVAQGSGDFLSFTLADPAAETGQAAIGVKLADVTYTATSGNTPASLTVDTTNGKVLDASDAIPAIASYVQDVLDNASANLEVTAEGDNYVTVVLDTRLTPELIEEGYVREIISKIQSMRKEADFNVTDRIKVYAEGNDKIAGILAANAGCWTCHSMWRRCDFQTDEVRRPGKCATFWRCGLCRCS